MGLGDGDHNRIIIDCIQNLAPDRNFGEETQNWLNDENEKTAVGYFDEYPNVDFGTATAPRKF